ncbi:MAG: hypothetical protein CBR30_05595 [Dictyoglomus sp. NZ13-RE01]|nr:MAG: hypothetical protein CBR30_05595 [Dictyoglomus sp. NZ13-RE01]
MREERYRILKMIEEGKISSEDGEELLKKLEENYDFKSSEKRLLRIYIEEEGVNRVNITIPLSFLKWGLKFANKYSVQYGGVDLSPEEIEKILNDPDFRGKIVDIQSDEDSTRVIVEII